MSQGKTTTSTLLSKKQRGEKLVVVTAYDATMARLLDAGGVDVLMVGDSLGMVIQGRADTLSVTLEEMIYHCRAVTRARPSAHVVCDLPFLSYQVTPEQALEAAGRLVKEGRAESVKLEGGSRSSASVRKIVDAGIPVMGHLGLTPQSVHQFGGFRVQGKTRRAAEHLIEEALILQDAGVYAIVIEGVPSEVARRMTEAVSVPTIGIGAGPGTDGQVLVSHDLLGLYAELSPKFVRRFRELGEEVTAGVREYAEAVRQGSFPAAEHEFSMAPGEELPPGEREG